MTLQKTRPIRSKARRKKCRHCREWFQPFNTLQRACSPECAIEVARKDGQKELRKANRLAREALKTRGDYQREAQQAFNAYIRERDHGQPCISCGTTEGWDRSNYWDCGHYRSTGANPELRFVEMNAAAQCKRCNQHLSGNVVNYRIGLRQRIGDEKLEWLEGPHPATNYSRDDLKAIRDEYRAKARELKRQRQRA